MATEFPKIAPSGRSFTAPTFSTTATVSQSGVVSRRMWGSRAGNARLDLRFDNLRDSEAAKILNAYNSAKGSVDSLTLPSEVFDGASDALMMWLKGNATGSGLIWCFTEGSAPQVESVSPGRSNIRVSLTAELRMN